MEKGAGQAVIAAISATDNLLGTTTLDVVSKEFLSGLDILTRANHNNHQIC